MKFQIGDRVAVERIGSGRYQRQATTAAIVTRIDEYRDAYTVRYFDLYQRRIASTRVSADRIIAADEMPLRLGDGAWEEIEADLNG